MTTNQVNALSEANVRRSQESARTRIVKSLREGKVNFGLAVLLLTAHSGMYRQQAVNLVSDVAESM